MNIQATRPRTFACAILALMLPLLPAGCANQANDATRRQLESNQALIEKQQRELATIQSQQGTSRSPVPGKTGTCDKKVEAAATRRGGDAYTTGDMTRALGYYQDALTACPSSSKADMNLARVYETLDNREA